jgi:hypothetical protein
LRLRVRNKVCASGKERNENRRGQNGDAILHDDPKRCERIEIVGCIGERDVWRTRFASKRHYP